MHFTFPMISGYRMLLTCLFLFPFFLFAQTLLLPGDLVVAGLAANTGDGSGVDCAEAAGTDELSLVAFREIATGTVIDITDNGWERSKPGFWGNEEGFVRLTRTGPAIPAGQLMRFRFPPSGNAYLSLTPDEGWTFEDMGTTSVNFNSNGDQLFFMQGGVWDNGTSAGDDATYTGGKLIFAFNSRIEWLSFQQSASDSGLPAELTGCYSIQSGITSTNFAAYAGDTLAADRIVWLSRFHNPANWAYFDQCSDYPVPSGSFTVSPDTIALSCKNCGGCEMLTDQITVQLPETGGPYTLDYTDGRDTFRLENITTGFQFEVSTTDTLRLSILSVKDSTGCAIFSGLGDTLTLIAQDPPVLYELPDQSSCGPFTLQAIIGENLSGGQAYFSDPGYQNKLLPGDFLSADATIYIYDRLYNCETATQFDLKVFELPEASIGIVSQPSCDDPSGGALELYTSGNGPFSIFWNKEGFDGLRVLNGLPVGEYEAEVVDANSCQAVAKINLTEVPGPVLDCRPESSSAGLSGMEGRVRLSFSEGTPPYILSMEGPLSDTRSFVQADSLVLDFLPAGLYALTLMDATNCMSNCSFEILASDSVDCKLELVATASDATCLTEGRGAVSFTVSGGELPFLFDWSRDEFDGLAASENLSPGDYALTVADAAGCVDSLAFSIGAQENPEVVFSPVQPACSTDATGTLLISSINSGLLPLLLQTSGSASPIEISVLPFSLPGLGVGEYTYVLTDAAGCMQEIQFRINEPEIFDLDLGPDVWIAGGDSVVLGSDIRMEGVAAWTPPNFLTHADELSTVAFPTKTLDYTLTVTTAEGCVYSDEIRVKVNEFSEELFIPNAFSPDNDGNNDRFNIYGSSRVEKIRRLKIFNRWGELLYDRGPLNPSDASVGWDGKYNGIIQPVGVYIYVAEVVFAGDVTERVSGDFLLIR